MLAHKLVDLFPEWVISWFAVGSYYFLVGKQEHARRYLSRATQLDRVFGPSWLAYGHSFALGKRLVEISETVRVKCWLYSNSFELSQVPNSKLSSHTFSADFPS